VSKSVDVADMVQTGTPETAGQYVYTYTFPLDATASTIYNEIGAYGINAYNIPGEEDLINIVKIDLTSPTWQDEDPVDTKWYRDVLLSVKFGDKVEIKIDSEWCEGIFLKDDGTDLPYKIATPDGSIFWREKKDVRRA
jgi:hypothetical protein